MPGERWEQAIWRGVKQADLFLVVLSRRSVGKRGFLQREIRLALSIWQEKLDDDIYLIPARLDECEPPGALSQFQWVDLFSDGGFERLCAAIDEGRRRLHGVDRDAHPSRDAITVRKEQLRESIGSKFHIDLIYPQFDGPTVLSLDEVNTRIKACCLEEVHMARLLALHGDQPMEDRAKSPDGWLDGFFQVTLASKEIVSVSLDLSGYNYPAAHPNFWRRTLTFTLNPVVELSVQDVFKYDTSLRPKLIELCDEQIRRQSDGEFELSTFIGPGADSSGRYDLSEFKLFNVSTTGMSFSFVGPFVVKIAEVSLPFAVLHPYLLPGAPVWRLACGSQE